jgi:hypothetical protein
VNIFLEIVDHKTLGTKKLEEVVSLLSVCAVRYLE